MCQELITHSALIAAIDNLAATRRIVGPVKEGAGFFYREVERAAQLDLSFSFCVYGPRAFLFPPSETLFQFELSTCSFKTRPVIDRSPLALIGVHPCDIHAIRLLDHVFTADHPDEHYLARRRATLIVGIDCPRPCTSGVFCRDMHTHEAAEGFDVMLYPLPPQATTSKARYGVVIGTPQGADWLRIGRQCVAASSDDRQALESYHAAKNKAFAPALKTPAEKLLPLLDRSYDSLIWEATARRCYSCGSCNLSCPTCYCFNILDELNLDLHSGSRKREWDGCQLRNFAEVAGGHNFRPKAASRLRHRIYRKAKWIREQTNLPGCVGCARCDRACTARISSVQIYNQLAEETP